MKSPRPVLRVSISTPCPKRATHSIAVSAPSVEGLDAAVAPIEQAVIQASCETRLLVGQQSAASTAAAMPMSLGVDGSAWWSGWRDRRRG